MTPKEEWSEDRHSQLLDTAPDAMVVVGRDGDAVRVGIEVLRFSAAPTQPQPHPQPR